MYKRAKTYVNVGELGKAMTAIRSNGIATVNDSVLKQLRSKHPQRKLPVEFPPQDELSGTFPHGVALDKKSDEYSQRISSILYSVLPSVTVTSQNILSEAKKLDV